MNLISLAEKLSGEQRTPTTFDAQRCLHSKDKLSDCTACFDVCPTGAILPGKPPQFDAGACQHCFACLPACPTGAYAAEDELPDLLRCLARLDIDTLELICQHHPAPSLGLAGRTAAIQVRGCLAGLGVPAYLQLSTHALERVVVRTDACEQCPWQSPAAKLVHDQVDDARQWLRGWQREGFIEAMSVLEEGVKRPLHRAGSPPVSRRDLFRGHVGEPPPTDITASLNPFHQRLRTLSALHRLAAHSEHASMPLPRNSGFARVSVTQTAVPRTAFQTCSACGACARACPTRALVLEKDDGKFVHGEPRFQLSFSMQACIGCDACAHVCPQQAITVDHERTLGDILQSPDSGSSAGDETLLQGKLVTCERCQGSFAAGSMQDGFCSVCAFRRQNPFGSRMPPHLANTLSARKKRPQQTGENK